MPAAASRAGSGSSAWRLTSSAPSTWPARQVLGGPALVGDRVGHQQDQLAIAGGQLRADPAQQAREERIAEQPAGRLGDDHRDRVAAPGDEAAGGAVGDVAEAFDGRLDVDPDVGADPRRAVDDARDGRPGDAREMGDLFERGAGAPGTTAGLGHVNSDFCESALTLDEQSIRRCQESALTLIRSSFRGRRGVRSGVGRCSSGCRRERGGAMRHYGDGATDATSRVADHDNGRGPRTLRGRHRHRGPLPAADRVQDVLRLFDRLRRRAAEHARLPGLPRAAGRAADDQPAGGRARPDDRRGDRGDGPGRDPLGSQELLLPGPARRATRSASTTCRSPRSAG